ncbi:hypothetical protein LXA43DRAFT_977568 [Ganoderma leucocontextum]|nr:hypothetical protein LXA43DRAFT_977568 [Ganoderma leucocontextum]
MAHAAVLAEKEEFCDAYFPVPGNPDKSKPVLTENPFAGLEKFKGNEAKIRAKFAKAVNDHNLVPGLVFRECSERPDPLYIDPNRQKVDAAWYFRRDANDDKKQDWGNQVIPVEFKGDETADDPFDEDKENISTPQRIALFMLVVVGKRARFTCWDRSGTVVTRAFNHIENWKFFCDILWRIGNCSDAQLGFDPTATRLSEADPDWHRMLMAAREKVCVDHSERVLKNGTLPEGEFVYVQDMFKQSLVPGWPWYRVDVPDGEKKFRNFLIARPTFHAKGMAGRGTRGYVALDCVTERFVWLKDAWRANYEFVDQEGDILAALNEAQVPNVPTMLCHGDIRGQATETPDWWERERQARENERQERKRQERGRLTPDSSTTDSSRTYVNSSSSMRKKRQREDGNEEAAGQSGTKTEERTLRLHKHYRLVAQEVAMSLDRFEYPQQLVQVMFDCVFAHGQAATKLETPLLHHDISSGNILMYPRVRVDEDGVVTLKWRGILADWEMSKPLHKDKSEPRTARQPERTGTWQYLSIALLRPGLIQVGIPDELESFFHVLLYYALRYIKSANCSGESIANFLDQYFDLYGYEDGTYICGALKRSMIKEGKICVGSDTYIRFDNPLDDLFVQLLSWFKARYIVLAHEKNKIAAAKRQPATSASNTTGPVLAQYGPIQPAAKRNKEPTDEETALAELVKSHGSMIVALGTTICGSWPDQKAEDQIPSGWKPTSGSRFQQPLSKNVENKRKRIEKSKAFFSEPPPPRQLVIPRSPHTPQKCTAISLGFVPEEQSP